jgi:hypothetical protein
MSFGKRIVIQEMSCTCNNMCENGQRTPYPLNFRDDDNVLGEYCVTCEKMTYLVVETFKCDALIAQKLREITQ